MTTHHKYCDKAWAALNMGENIGDECPICHTINQVQREERVAAAELLERWANDLQVNELHDPADLFILRRAAQIVRLGITHDA